MIEIGQKIVSQRIKQEKEEQKVSTASRPRPSLVRGKVLPAEVYRIKANNEHALYVTIADIAYEGKRFPYEIFLNTKESSHKIWADSLTLLISALFRQHIESGLNLNHILSNLSQVYDPMGGYWVEMEGGKRKYMNSIVSEVGHCIGEHLKKLYKEEDYSQSIKIRCPSCGEKTYILQDGCFVCLSCGHSKCG